MVHAVAARRERNPMVEKTAQSVANLGYHAHIYYDPIRTRAVAERVCAEIGEKFRVEIDGFRDNPVGPHPIANALVIFKPEQFEHVVPYLMLNRVGLDVLVHPLTKDAVEDHSSYPIWLGNPVELKLHAAARTRRAAAGRSQCIGWSQWQANRWPLPAQRHHPTACTAACPFSF
jgi:DOPA 4,5-dioxygenase